MYYVYILKSKIRKLLYIGFTNNLNKRLEEHNQGNFLLLKSTDHGNYVILRVIKMNKKPETEKKN